MSEVRRNEAYEPHRLFQNAQAELEAQRLRSVPCGGEVEYACDLLVDPQRAKRCCGEHWCEACYAEHSGEMCHG